MKRLAKVLRKVANKIDPRRTARVTVHPNGITELYVSDNITVEEAHIIRDAWLAARQVTERAQ